MHKNVEKEIEKGENTKNTRKGRKDREGEHLVNNQEKKDENGKRKCKICMKM